MVSYGQSDPDSAGTVCVDVADEVVQTFTHDGGLRDREYRASRFWRGASGSCGCSGNHGDELLYVDHVSDNICAGCEGAGCQHEDRRSTDRDGDCGGCGVSSAAGSDRTLQWERSARI